MVVRVGAVPPANAHLFPNASVRLPVPSCVTNIEPVCPASMLVGFASVRFPPKVTEKFCEVSKLGVIVVPSVSALIVASAGPST